MNSKQPLQVYYKHPLAFLTLSSYFAHNIPFHMKQLVVCGIGSDRCIGDAIGPLVGTAISLSERVSVPVFGTLKQPFHAANYEETMEEIQLLYPDAFIIAIDACLGDSSQIGTIIVDHHPIHPGMALQKQLQPIGHLSIKAIVNKTSMNPLVQLQSTRLHFIMELSELIANTFIHSLESSMSQTSYNPTNQSYYYKTR